MRPATQPTGRKRSIFLKKLLDIILSLGDLIRSLKLKELRTTWSTYYDEASERNDYLEQKQKIIVKWVNDLPNINTAVDAGANEGEFSKLLAEKGISTIAGDFDPYCINRLYNKIKNSGEKKILPLIVDLSNPSPAIGANNKERNSFIERINADLVLALAIIHHLCIGKNMPFHMIAELFQDFGSYLIIEFIPPADEKVKMMLQEKENTHNFYTEKNFADQFKQHFSILKSELIPGTERTLYLMKRY